MKRNYELNECICFQSVYLVAKAADFYEGENSQPLIPFVKSATKLLNPLRVYLEIH